MAILAADSPRCAAKSRVHLGAAALAVIALALLGCGGAPQGTSAQDTAADASATDAASPADADALAAGPDAAPDAAPTDVPFVMADHPAAPQVQKGKGGVLLHPHARVVTFDGDPQRTGAEAFVADLAGSAYWTAATAEYGVGDLVVDAPIHLALVPTPSVTDAEVEAFLVDQFATQTAQWGAPDPATIYVVVYPLGVTITWPESNGVSCKDFGGYHGMPYNHPLKVPFAVIPACPGFAGPGEDLAHVYMRTVSHELLEAATDPDVFTAPAWSKVDPAHAGWGTVAGASEIGDLCTFAEVDIYPWPNQDYISERAWSNLAAAAGHDPCQPTPNADPYFNAAPETPDTVTYAGHKIAGVHIAAGSDAIVPVHLFSDAPTDGPWEVDATDYASWYLSSAPQLQFDWDGQATANGSNGDVLNLHITVIKADAKKVEPYFLFSRLGPTTHLWVGFVGN